MSAEKVPVFFPVLFSPNFFPEVELETRCLRDGFRKKKRKKSSQVSGARGRVRVGNMFYSSKARFLEDLSPYHLLTYWMLHGESDNAKRNRFARDVSG